MMLLLSLRVFIRWACFAYHYVVLPLVVILIPTLSTTFVSFKSSNFFSFFTIFPPFQPVSVLLVFPSFPFPRACLGYFLKPPRSFVSSIWFFVWFPVLGHL